MDNYGAATKMAMVTLGANVRETTTPRKRVVDLDSFPPPREDGPRPIPRRFAHRVYEALKSAGLNGEGMTLTRSAETYGTCKIQITRNIVGINGEPWSAGDEVENVPVNVACLLVNDKLAYFDRSEFQGEGEIEALEKLGYRVEPPMQRAIEKKEFQGVVARKRKGFVADSLDPALKSPS
jgi:hypothetical protein